MDGTHRGTAPPWQRTAPLRGALRILCSRSATMFRWLLVASLLTTFGFLSSPALYAQDKEKDKEESKIKFDLTFVRTVEPVMNKMFELAKITKDDIVYDLGCGDAFILCEACKRFGCKGVGVDLDPQRVKQANDMVKKFG